MQRHKYYIITPTHNRPERLLKCVLSVLQQSGDDFVFELLVINDSPDYDYSLFESNGEIKMGIEKKNITYIKNEKNSGNNFCKNLALSYIKNKMKDGAANINEYVIFLDDDDWFAENALHEIGGELNRLNSPDWLVTNRTLESGQKLTLDNTGKTKINYFWDYLVSKRFTGDATHTIKKEVATQCRFALSIKNGEEVYYFLQLPKYFFYSDLRSTISDGYLVGGMTEMLKNKYKTNTLLFFKENKTYTSPRMLTYLILRIVIILKKLFRNTSR